jgi:hypothetical protein
LKKTLRTLRILLESIHNKGGSAFKSLPYAPNVLEKYVNAYLKQTDELEYQLKNELCKNVFMKSDKRNSIKHVDNDEDRLVNF